LITSHTPLRINVGFLYNLPIGTFRDFPFDETGFDLAVDISTSNLTGNIRISRTSEGLLLQSEFHTHIPATCVRCLEDFDQPLNVEFTELYVFPKQRTCEQPVDDEPELVLPENGYIDVSPLLREYLLLEIPIKPLHDPECKGLCPQCGVNWNDTTCTHYSSSSALNQVASGLTST